MSADTLHKPCTASWVMSIINPVSFQLSDDWMS